MPRRPAAGHAARSRLRLTRRGRLAASVLTAVALGAAAAAAGLIQLPTTQDPADAQPSPSASPIPPPPIWEAPALAAPLRAVPLADDAHLASTAAARAVFDRTSLVVVTGPPIGAPGPGHRLGRWLAARLGVPLVHPGPDLASMVDELGVASAVAVDLTGEELRQVEDVVVEVRTAWSAEDPRVRPDDAQQQPSPADPSSAGVLDDPVALREAASPPVDAWLGEVAPALRLAATATRVADETSALLFRTGDPAAWAVATTVAAAGIPTATTAAPDPRADPTAVARFAASGRAIAPAGTASSWADVDADTLAWQLETVARSPALPNGRQTLFPGTALIALYGNPEGGALGVLGEQPVDQAIQRARDVAAPYVELAAADGTTIVPTFEIIATVASGGPSSRGDYSRRTPIATLRPWVDAAREAGVYVILDLQPGRTSFLDQAIEYEELLREPHVGLALDPEWRLKPNQVHLRQIGSVGAAEVNAVADWLAALVREHRLPQKAFVLHQFKLSMLADRHTLALGHPELAAIIHVDGQGGQAAKDATYRTVVRDAPPHVWWGWKNFYDEDVPGIRSPQATWAVEPRPVMISYQ